MAFLRRTTPKAEAAQKLSQPTVVSRLLATALEGTDERTERFTLLDLGCGTAGTVQFFGGLNCATHLVFSDCRTLAEELANAREAEEEALSCDQITSICRHHLALPDELQLDLILFWDFLHFFDLMTVRVLSTILLPHLHQNSRGYGFSSLYNDQAIKPYNYAITSGSEVCMRAPPPANPGLPFAHSQQTLSENFTCMRISRGTLLKEGHLELLLEV